MDMNELFEEMERENTSLKKALELINAKYKIIDSLYNFRKENNLTQKDFAERIGVKQQAISRFEKGEIDARLSFIEKVMQGMNAEINIRSKEYIKINNTIEFKKKTIKPNGWSEYTIAQ